MQGKIGSGTLVVLSATALAVGVGPAAFADKPDTPRGAAAKGGAPAPPPHAPAHGLRGTSPQRGSAPAGEGKDGAPAARGGRGDRRVKASRGSRAANRSGAARGTRRSTPANPGARRSRGADAPRGRAGDAPRGRRTDAPRGRSGDAPRGRSGDAPKGGQPKTTICHATGSATNPYVEITIANPAVRAHERHQDGRDIVPAPAGGCPEAASVPAAVTAESALRRLAGGVARVLGVPAAAPATPVSTTASSREEAVASDATDRDRDRATSAGEGDEQQVLGVAATAGDTDAAGPLAQVADRGDAQPTAAANLAASDDDGGLPFTGLDLVWILVAAVAALLAGFALRRASRSGTAARP